MLQQEFNASCEPIHPCGIEIKGVDLAGMGGKMPPKLAGAVEVLMAEHGFALFRGQGTQQNESGVSGQYLSGDQQCALSENFGAGALHSTHGRALPSYTFRLRPQDTLAGGPLRTNTRTEIGRAA